MIYSKTLQTQDYHHDIVEVQHVLNTARILGDTPYRFDHPHRAWEYGLVLTALMDNRASTILEIGGGGSLFAPAAALLGMEILQVDRKNCTHWTTKQEERLGISLPYAQADFPDGYIAEEKFDAVVSISVIEHVSADDSASVETGEVDTLKRMQFFERMLGLTRLGGLVAITTDFLPGKIKNIKFDEAEILTLYEAAHAKGFDWFGGEHDYTYTGNFVNHYTFASLILRREQ